MQRLRLNPLQQQFQHLQQRVVLRSTPTTPHQQQQHHRRCRRGSLAVRSAAQAPADPPLQNSNLGALARTAVPDRLVDIDPYNAQRVSVESFANRGAAVDGGTAALNVALLLLLVYLATERIFGLDKAVTRALLRWKEGRQEARMYEALEARQRLERQWGGGSEGGSGSGGGSSGGSGDDSTKGQR